MSFKIITADERMENHSGIKGQIWGPCGIGKTSLLWTLDPETTLALDLEAGMLSVQGWKGQSMSISTWPDCRDATVWLCGPNPALRPDQFYSQAHYDYVISQAGPPPEGIKTIFIDSTTNAGRYCLQWATGQPRAFSEKTGKPDMRGAYGLLGQEIVAWVEQWQHAPSLNVWLVGGLEERTDDFNRMFWTPLLEGAKGAQCIPYVFDQVVTMQTIRPPEGAPYRAFVCTSPNPWGYPAKDRSGRLDQIEEPHLGRLMDKIRGPKPETIMNYAIETTTTEETK
jgi:hypothetical protein